VIPQLERRERERRKLFHNIKKTRKKLREKIFEPFAKLVTDSFAAGVFLIREGSKNFSFVFTALGVCFVNKLEQPFSLPCIPNILNDSIIQFDRVSQSRIDSLMYRRTDYINTFVICTLNRSHGPFVSPSRTVRVMANIQIWWRFIGAPSDIYVYNICNVRTYIFSKRTTLGFVLTRALCKSGSDACTLFRVDFYLFLSGFDTILLKKVACAHFLTFSIMKPFKMVDVMPI
jgi:hypothetical protein